MSYKTRISLIATVWNDLEGTRKFLQKMDEQTRRPDEIVIADAVSTDGTWELLEEYRASGAIPLIGLQEDRCSPARGRNLAAAKATHDILAVTDIGCDWEKDWFEGLAAPFEENPDLDAVMGGWRVRWEDQKTPWARADYILQGGLEFLPTPKDTAANRSIAYKKDFYLGLGGLPEDLTYAADDTSLAFFIIAASDKVGAAPTPNCIWERPQSLQALLKESRRNFRGAGEAGFWMKHNVFVAVRLAAEIGSLLCAAISFAMGWTALAIAFLLFAALLLASKTSKLAKRRRDVRERSGVTASMRDLLVLDYGTRIWGLRGFIQGYFHGNKHCLDCRAKNRAAGIRWW